MKALRDSKVCQKIRSFLCTYPSILLCDLKYIPSNLVHCLRKQLREFESEIVCGDGSVIKQSLKDYASSSDLPSFHTREGLLEVAESVENHQICLVFTNKDVRKIADLCRACKVRRQLNLGEISAVEVTIPEGNIRINAKYFDELGFESEKKTSKTIYYIELKSDYRWALVSKPLKIVSVGQKILLPEFTVLNDLHIKPIEHIFDVFGIYLGGKVYESAGIIGLNDEKMGQALSKCISHIAAFGLATGITNLASEPHVIAHAFKVIESFQLELN